MRWRIAAATAAVLLLAGCTWSGAPPAPTTPGPHSTDLDHGGLVVTPLTGVTPKVGQDQAARVLAGTTMAAPARLTPVLAKVVMTLPQRHPGDASLGGRWTVPVAWVYLQPDGRGTQPCLLHRGLSQASPSPPPPDASKTVALVVDADSGAAFDYWGAGAGICGGLSQPQLTRVALTQSVAFSTSRPAPLVVRISYQVPPCGRLAGYTFVPGRATATVLVPTGPCTGPASTKVETTRGIVHDRVHGPTGLVCWGTYDSTYGVPKDCVAA